MNYLPMLSHQQLLYLLTMSFVSRVPRSLLPGGRSSRLRDRQREEREYLVKKAFVEDILNENKNLSALLQEPGFRLVMWDPDLLPRHSALALAAAAGGDAACEMQNKEKTSNLLEELSLFMEKLNDDVYYDDDDGLLNDFQVDSGTLACVACGVLGFPFMSVVQPSEKALKDLSERQGEITTLSSEKSDCEWNTSSRYTRPRIFCLEHTIELQRLLQPRGGLKFLVICHKDFQKFKAHAAIVAEEVKIPFSYDDVSLESASQEELSLIDLAIADEENNEHGVDWTSKLGINLRYCVKVRKSAPTKKIQHALSLGGLFSDTDISTIKWLQRKSRSKAKLGSTSSLSFVGTSNHLLDSTERRGGKKMLGMFTPREQLEVKVDRELVVNLDSQVERKEEKIIQYSRKKKSNPKPFGDQGQELATVNPFSSSFNGAHGEELLEVTVEFVSAIDGNITNMVDAVSIDGELAVNSKDVDNPCNNLCSSSFAGAHGEEHLEVTVEFVSVLDGNITNSCKMVNAVSADLTSVTREHRGHSSSQTVLASTVDNHDEPRKLTGEYLCSDDVSVRDDVQEAVEMSDQEFEELRSTVTNIEDDQQSQMLQLTEREEAVPSDHTQVEEEDIVPETSIASENIVDDTTRDDDEPLASRDISSSSNGDEASSNGLQAPDDESEVASSENTEAIETLNSNTGGAKKKRKMETESETTLGFIRSPCEGLRSRGKRKVTTTCETTNDEEKKKKPVTTKRLKKPSSEVSTTTSNQNRCYLEGCKMTFESKAELQTHKRNRCTHEGCGKKFRAHKYLLLHQRVHNDDRPFACPWKGCAMTFKWQWARTEHYRLHTGERPYKCKIDGCGLSFRFVSDYSRHRRKTGHYVVT